MKKNKTLTIGIPVLIVLLAVGIYDKVLSRPYGDITALRQDREMKELRLGKQLSLVAQKGALSERLSKLKKLRMASGAKLLTGQTATLAGASLQETVKAVLLQSGATIYSEKINKSKELDSLSVISVGVDTEFPDMGALSEVLYALETGTPYLVIENLNVRIAVVHVPKDIFVTFNVTGLYSQ